MTAALAHRQYTLEIFASILPSDEYITDEAIVVINKLAAKVGAVGYQKTPVFSKRERSRRRYVKSSITAEDWEEMRNFKSTKLDKNEKGIEKDINDLRLLLNKITKSNYNEMRDKILILLKRILENKASEEDLVRVGKSIFEIGSMNKFWSELYATLYKDLITTFPVMEYIYEKNFSSFLTLFKNIQHVDSEKDYDEFCRVNKENASRRALSCFFVHLMKNGVIPVEDLCKVISSLQTKFLELIQMVDKRNETEEIAANLVTMVAGGGHLLYEREAVRAFIEGRYQTLSPRSSRSNEEDNI